MDTMIRVQILDETVCISHSADRLGWKEKENFEFKPVKLRLKIDLVSYPARAKGFGKYEYTREKYESSYSSSCHWYENMVSEKENSEEKPVKKDLVSHPCSAERLVNTHAHTRTQIYIYIQRNRGILCIRETNYFFK